MQPDSESVLTSVSHRAMATEFVAMLPPNQEDKVELVVAALDTLPEIEAALTIYRDDSEISKINRLAGKQAVEVSRSTFDLLTRAQEWSVRTEGAFDVTAGPLVDVWGFTTRSGRKPKDEEIQSARESVGYEKLLLNERLLLDERLLLNDSRCEVSFAHPEMRINLGAIGKGHALDLLASKLISEGIDDFLIHGGNSSVLARGDQIPNSGEGWLIGISHPTKPTRRLGGVRLRDCALGTSGSGKQFFHHQGRRYGHVIDPRTGVPVDGLLALTVLTESAADADAAATGCFVAGPKQLESLAQQWQLAMIAVTAGKRQDDAGISLLGPVEWAD